MRVEPFQKVGIRKLWDTVVSIFVIFFVRVRKNQKHIALKLIVVLKFVNHNRVEFLLLNVTDFLMLAERSKGKFAHIAERKQARTALGANHFVLKKREMGENLFGERKSRD